MSRVYRTELSPLSFLRRTSYVFPDAIATIHGDRRTSYREMAARVNRLASALIADGIAPGDRVAFLCPNIPAMLEAHYGVPAAGAVLVAINIRLSPDEVNYILQHSGAKMLFIDREFLSRIEGADLSAIRVVEVADSGMADDPYEVYLAGGSDDPVADLVTDEDQTISINYTSGTTGRPKGVMYSHRGAYLAAIGNCLETGLTFNSTYLWTLPMFHCNGWTFTWSTVAVAAANVCLRRVDPAEIWRTIDSANVTHYCGAPTVQIGVVNAPEAHRLDREVRVGIAGAPPSPTVIAQLRALNLRPIHLYGLTETYGPTTVCAWKDEWSDLPDDDQARILARQGQGYVVSDLVRVVDDEMRDVPRDAATLGEVVMRGNIVAKGYFNNPDATAEAFRGGWFHSGDIAIWHPDGYIELRDRKKDIIISGGENISTIEVEQAITRHPAVLECAVIAIPDDRWGERPKAFVTLKPGQTVAEVDLIAFCRQYIAGFKLPAAVSFGELPKTSTGKVQKFVLRDKEWAGREKRIN